MESNLSIQRVGAYSMTHLNTNKKACKLCGDADWADVIIEGICGKCLLHHYDSTIGLHVTDRPDLLSDEEKKRCHLHELL